MVLVDAVPQGEAFQRRGLVAGHPQVGSVLPDGRQIVMDARIRGEPKLDAHPLIIGDIGSPQEIGEVRGGLVPEV
jgi:hypothetical protein